MWTVRSDAGPSGLCFGPNDPFLWTLSGISIGILLVPIAWVWVAWKQWQTCYYYYYSQQCVLVLAWILMMGGQTCVVGLITTWSWCPHPYLYLLASPLKYRCFSMWWYRIADIFYAVGPPLFVLAFIKRFEPTYLVLGQKNGHKWHMVMYGLIGTATLLMLAASITSISRRHDQDVDPEEISSYISQFENQAYIVYGVILMLCNILTTGMGVKFVTKALREINSEASHLKDPYHHKRYLSWTFTFLILNLLSVICFALTSFGILIPNWLELPLPLRSQILSFIVLMYFTFMMISMIMFENSLRASRNKEAHSTLATMYEDSVIPVDFTTTYQESMYSIH
jgi:hypothetical protein